MGIIISTSRIIARDELRHIPPLSVYFCVLDIEYYLIIRDGQIIRRRTYPKPEISYIKNHGRTPGSQIGQRHQEQGHLMQIPTTACLCLDQPSFLFPFCQVCFIMHLFIYCIFWFSPGVSAEVQLHQDNRHKLGLS